MSDKEYPPSVRELEGLFVNNPKLEQIRAYLGRFNPIKVMGMEGMEIRHSAILAWLLNPQESHGLGDKFLRGFLAEALRISEGGQPKSATKNGGSPTRSQPSAESDNNSDLVSGGRGKLSALDVLHSNMMDAEVRREWKNIDLLVLSPKNQWAFVIENKFHSSQHGGQLEKYMDIAEEYFPNNTEKVDGYEVVQGIFLTLWHEEPKDKKNRYVCVRYKDICQVLRPLVERTEQTLGQEVQIFINHYLEIIEEASNMSDEKKNGVVKLARKLYRENRAVIDFVALHGRSNDLKVAADKLFGDFVASERTVNGEGCICSYPARVGGNFVGILPASWYRILSEEKLKSLWVKENHEGDLKLPLIVWIELVGHEDGSGYVALYAQVGPLSDPIRRELINAIGEHQESKVEKAKERAGNVARFFEAETKPIENIHDAKEISAAVKKLLDESKSAFEVVGERLAKKFPQK